MWVKICGITNEEDALMAVALGADAVGFVFAPSPRQVTVGVARDIVRRLPPDVLTIGVFRDQAPSQVIDTVLAASLSGAQLHGHETAAEAAEVRAVSKVLIVAFVAGDPRVTHCDDYLADAILLDSARPGSGDVFDWSMAEDAPAHRRLILAGGLTAENVGAAVRQVRPWGVDVSTGVESEPNRKDPLLVRAFVHAARDAAGRAGLGSDPDAGSVGVDVDTDVDLLPFDWADASDL